MKTFTIDHDSGDSHTDLSITLKIPTAKIDILITVLSAIRDVDIYNAILDIGWEMNLLSLDNLFRQFDD